MTKNIDSAHLENPQLSFFFFLLPEVLKKFHVSLNVRGAILCKHPN